MARRTNPRARGDQSGVLAKRLVPLERVEQRIVLIRGQRVLLDLDLATLYDVETRTLVQAVKRNGDRFPADFMFRLTEDEMAALRSQNVISKPGRGGRRYAPYAFTEQGAAMLSSVLRSERAIAVNIEIMRAFVRLRQVLATHKELARKLAELERDFHTKTKAHEAHIRRIYSLLEALMEPPPAPKKGRIGFRTSEETT